MFTAKLGYNTGQKTPAPQEGDLYKVLEYHGKSFEIRYGFYEERDRHTRYAEPVAIYPDFREEPHYAQNGQPFVTAMQHPCQYYEGKEDENSVCEDCRFYRHCEELLGLCTNLGNQKSPEHTA